MTRKLHGRVIDTSIRLAATPQKAWEAWADPQQIANWFVDRAEGAAKPGEVMTWFFDTFNFKLPVPIVEAEPGRTFVTGSGDAPGPSGLPYLMEITVTQDGGETVMRLVNSGFATDAAHDDEFEGVVSGWKMALATLKRWIEHYPDASRQHVLAIAPASYEWNTLKPLFHTPEGRRSWLGAELASDEPVLVDTGREVLLPWDAVRGVLGVKAFRMGPQRVVALDASTWGEPRAAADARTPLLQQALGRLTARLSGE